MPYHFMTASEHYAYLLSEDLSWLLDIRARFGHAMRPRARLILQFAIDAKTL